MQNKVNSQQEPCQRARRTHYVDDFPGLELEEHPHTTTYSSFNLFTITEGGQNPFVLQVSVNQTPAQMELDMDTAASISLINKQAFNFIADHSHIAIRTTHVHLKTYTCKALEILGEADVTVNYGEEKQQ